MQQKLYCGPVITRIEPEDTVQFNNEVNKLCISSFTIINETSSNIAYKVKITNPKFYQVKPSLGVINGHNKVTIEINTILPFQKTAQMKDKFMVLTTVVQDTDLVQDLQEFWKIRDKSLIQENVLKINLMNTVDPVTSENIVNEPIDQSLFQSTVVQSFSKSKQDSNILDELDQPNQKQDLIYEQQQNTKLSTELNELRIKYQQIQANTITRQTYSSLTDQSGFTLSQILVVLVVSLLVGYLIGN